MTDLTPTQDMKDNAQKGLNLKQEHTSDAATDKGMSVAQKIVKQTESSVGEVKDMYGFFSRHEVDKNNNNFGNEENLSNGYISWLLRGGDSGYDWAQRKREILQNNNNY